MDTHKNAIHLQVNLGESCSVNLILGKQFDSKDTIGSIELRAYLLSLSLRIFSIVTPLGITPMMRTRLSK